MILSKPELAVEAIKNIKNWPTYFLDYFGFKKGKMTYRLNNGVKYVVRGGCFDRIAINETWFHKIYTPEDFQIKKEDVVVDIGAHIGIFSIYASTVAAKVYSFEPFPENYHFFEENIESNDITNVELIRKAINSKKGKMRLILDDFHTHSLVKGSASTGNFIEVETITLEDFIKEQKIEKIDFLKMDCEGSEYEILKNCPESVLNKIEKISMEYHHIDDEKNGNVMKEILESKGYEVRAIEVLEKNGLLYAKKPENWDLKSNNHTF
jgi:FkbM family methyltransferase